MDFRRRAIDDLRRYETLRAGRQSCQYRLEELEQRMTTLPAYTATSPVVGSGSNRTEETWVNIIDAITDERERLSDADKQLRAIEGALNAIGERDRKVLLACYASRHRRSMEDIAEVMGVEVRTLYRWREQALIEFTRARYAVVIT
jgi:DNA-directed RNA polymerase specialized sigma subunit